MKCFEIELCLRILLLKVYEILDSEMQKSLQGIDLILSLRPLPVVYVDGLATQPLHCGYHRPYLGVRNFFIVYYFGINLVFILDKPII